MTLSGRILITGGAGTLGTAIMTVAQRNHWPCTFTVFSRSESRQAVLRRRFPRAKWVIGDVRDSAAVTAAVAGHDLVIHAAALKRIPECEAQPAECVATNVTGSANVAWACIWHGVPGIAISTDKACRATTTYGASKLLMESVWTAGSHHVPLTFVRYGNVVDSTGSVIPLWRQQYAAGRALPITDRRMTRFWLSPSEAVQGIVRAAALPAGHGWIPKISAMPIMAVVQTLFPGAKTDETGLRSREKLHEDLVATDEPAVEQDTGFVLGGDGPGGLSYTSSTAPLLTEAAFRAMLTDAARIEDGR